jgi:methyl-accepting chemotaxis protein
MKIGSKITSLLCVIVIVSLTSVGLFTYIKSSQVVYNQAKGEMMLVNQKTGETMNALLSKEVSAMNTIARQKAIIDFLSTDISMKTSPEYANATEEISKSLDTYVKDYGNTEHIFIIDKSGFIVADSDRNLIGKDLNDREYVKDTLNSGKSVISKVLISKSTGALVTAVTYPITKEGNLLGFVTSAVLVDSFSSIMTNINIAGSGTSYGYLVDSTGMMLYHPTKDKIAKPVENASIKAVVERLQKGETVNADFAEYLFNGKEKISVYQVIPGANWIMVIAADVADIHKPINEMNKAIILITALVAVLSIVLGYLYSLTITKPIKKLTQLIEVTGSLNITNDDSYDYLLKYKDEVGIMTKSVAIMRKSLREMATHLINSSDVLFGNAESVKGLVAALIDTTNDTLAATQELSAGMEESAASIEEINATSDEIEDSVSSISERASEGAAASGEISQRAEKLKQASIESAANAKKLYAEAKEELEDAIKESEAVSEINMLAQAILQITEQTNMLSLNAAIEAARAGEAGKGFAVVANEIRRLAEQSSASASSIQAVVTKVQASVHNLSDSATNVLGFIDKEVIKEFEEFVNTADQYNKDATMFNDMMVDFSATSQELNASITNITNSIKEVTTAVNEGAGGVEDIASKSNDIVEKTNDVNNISDINANSAKSLKELVSKFKL